ncbi:MAG: hypothetical protein ACYDDU_12000 [Dermatophilaceae bacterium]
MTRLPAAPAMTALVAAMHPDAPTEAAANVVVRLLAANAGVDAQVAGRSGTTAAPRVLDLGVAIAGAT